MKLCHLQRTYPHGRAGESAPFISAYLPQQFVSKSEMSDGISTCNFSFFFFLEVIQKRMGDFERAGKKKKKRKET